MPFLDKKYYFKKEGPDYEPQLRTKSNYMSEEDMEYMRKRDKGKKIIYVDSDNDFKKSNLKKRVKDALDQVTADAIHIKKHPSKMDDEETIEDINKTIELIETFIGKK